MNTVFYEALKDTDHNIYAQEQLPYSCRLHFHRAVEISYVKTGQVEFEVEGERFMAEENDIVFVHRYYPHRSTDRYDHRKYVVAVPFDFSPDIASLFEKTTLSPLLSDKHFNKTLLPYIEELITKHGNLTETVTIGFLNVIFGYLKSHYEPKKIRSNSKNVSVTVSILNFIDEHCNENLDLSTLAAKFGYNKSYFSRLFNDHIGMSVNAYLNNARMNRFSELKKKYPSASVTELALSAGFQSLATFYRVKK